MRWSEEAERLLGDLKTRYGEDGVNEDATIVFDAIQAMYDGFEGDVVIDSYLLHNLAACARIVMFYSPGTAIPWDKHDNVLQRTLDGLMRTLGKAIMTDRVRLQDGKVYCGYLQVPSWFVGMVKAEL